MFAFILDNIWTISVFCTQCYKQKQLNILSYSCKTVRWLCLEALWEQQQTLGEIKMDFLENFYFGEDKTGYLLPCKSHTVFSILYCLYTGYIEFLFFFFLFNTSIVCYSFWICVILTTGIPPKLKRDRKLRATLEKLILRSKDLKQKLKNLSTGGTRKTGM